MFDNLKNSILSLIPFTNDDFMVILAHFTSRTIKKYDYFLKEGEVCKHVAFIEKGVVRYYHNRDGKEQTTSFHLEGKWISNYSSFLQRLPSLYYIQAQSDVELFLLSYENLNKLYNEIRLMDRFGRLMAEQLFTASLNRYETMVLQTPEQRYLQLLNEQPLIFKLAPLKHIASYLNVEPESLSRIRKRLNRSQEDNSIS